MFGHKTAGCITTQRLEASTHDLFRLMTYRGLIWGVYWWSAVKGKKLTAKDTNVLTPRVRATVLGETVSYPFPQKNACSTLKNSKCPLEAGEDVTYQLSMPVLKHYPKIPLTIEFAFLDDKENVVVCFALPAKVADK
ncbi:ecdysteroid-regulated 16 kDa protein-like [Nasonia vitripennis]|uniref:MD-2-related lipid-recognition domain-containing protein n=1 Tax=Nasonia vitripennis TaxID=7425 RepID=A0A7M7IXI6_NASVI|nr:ecdysteroid-regulated 16 kDa protein-like [Nasonia vitripennis]